MTDEGPLESTDIWDRLAPYYDRLFPPGRAQLDFIGRVAAGMAHPGRRLLDVGCATGGYALALAEAGFEVTGVDISAEMVRLARTRAQTWEAERRSRFPPGRLPPPPRFLVADATNLEELPADEKAPFDVVICLGNTLAGLLSAAELGAALGEMARVLGYGGRAILQTVNYDRFAATGRMDFPPLVVPGPDGLVLDRAYKTRPDGLVTFVTTLRRPAPPDGDEAPEVLRAETVLRPTQQEELSTIARMAFHGEVAVYGDFLFTPWSAASPATIVVAERGPD